MYAVLIFFHTLIALGLITLVLVQRGKGAETGAAFGSGASQTLFGSQGSTPFLVKLTTTLGALFFATSLTLGYLNTKQVNVAKEGIVKSFATPEETMQAPAATTKPKYKKPTVNVPLPNDLPSSE